MDLWIEGAFSNPAHIVVSVYSRSYLWLGGKLLTAGKGSHICVLYEPKPPHSFLFALNNSTIPKHMQMRKGEVRKGTHGPGAPRSIWVGTLKARTDTSVLPFLCPFTEAWNELAILLGQSSKINRFFQRKVNYAHPELAPSTNPRVTILSPPLCTDSQARPSPSPL